MNRKGAFRHLFLINRSIELMAPADKSMPNMPNILGPLISAGGWAALSLGVAYAGVCFTLYQAQGNLIFRPLPTLLRTPAELGLPYEDVWIPAADGGRLHSWWLPNPNGKEDKVLLFCHGNYGNISYNTERIRFFHSLGFSILAFDYRGFGQSTGQSESQPESQPESQSDTRSVPNEKSTYADAVSAWRYLTETRGISPERITTMGHSMGGAIAIYLATQPIAQNMARLIITSSFTTMEDAVKAKRIYSLFPIRQLLTEPFDSMSRVKNLSVPVLYVHGDQDFDVPAPMSQQLYDASPEPKRIWLAPGASHNNIYSELGDRYAEVIQRFMADYPAQTKALGAKHPMRTTA